MTATTAIPDDVPIQSAQKEKEEKENSSQLTDRLRNQFRQNILLIMLRHSSNDRSKRRLRMQGMLLGQLTPQSVQVEVLFWLCRISLRLVVLDQRVCDIRACAQEAFVLRGEFGSFGQCFWADHRGGGGGRHLGRYVGVVYV